VLALQEASVIGMADGFAQATGQPALVNVHTGAGYAIVFYISHYLFRRDLMTASLQALAIAGPAWR
jgi:Thiamine pyrophosphate enzyme, N-terminal TPP binding domain